VPPAPQRPTGIELNFVASQWDWANKDSFIHDVISTDQRNPTLYANGKVYGADRTGGGIVWLLDPLKNTVQGVQVQPRIATGLSTKLDYYHGNAGGDEGVDQTARQWMASPHNPMLDEHGRLWMTEPIRPPGVENNPKWSASTVARDTNDPAALELAAKALASRNHGMQLGYYETKTNKFVTYNSTGKGGSGAMAMYWGCWTRPSSI
jgi:hypothetical protein